MSDVLETTDRKRRGTRTEVLDAREVRAAVAPVQARIGHWQRTLSLMKAKASRSNTDPVPLAGMCRSIAQEVASSRRIVQNAVPDRLRSHSRVLDIERSLTVVETIVTGLLRDLPH